MIKQKIIWPFPSPADGKDSGFDERAEICKKEGYKPWKAVQKKLRNKKWKFIPGQNGINFIKPHGKN